MCYVTEDFPMEVMEKREELKPNLPEERAKGMIAFINCDHLVVKDGNGSLGNFTQVPFEIPTGLCAGSLVVLARDTFRALTEGGLCFSSLPGASGSGVPDTPRAPLSELVDECVLRGPRIRPSRVSRGARRQRRREEAARARGRRMNFQQSLAGICMTPRRRVKVVSARVEWITRRRLATRPASIGAVNDVSHQRDHNARNPHLNVPSETGSGVVQPELNTNRFEFDLDLILDLEPSLESRFWCPYRM
ncbi:hypothetical protein EVAR_46970_1 [Eumeta japonica]|uniref:Uncharacterized protein n=1 Tax=Eumeta variegata TaxID=151549 RepID=A0A4C1X976_EUMVA|nr:hypothetical protein EVAR_46970_1 [Eumeta japonica]